MSGKRIEIVAIGKEKAYSVGAVVISQKGDVYVIHKIIGTDFKTSRHTSGQRHWKSIKNKIFTKLSNSKPINDFKGIEFLGTWGFGLESLPHLHKEYKMKKCNAIFVIDMRDYTKTAFNMFIAILTKEGLPMLNQLWEKHKKTHTFVFAESHPMVAITIADVSSTEKE